MSVLTIGKVNASQIFFDITPSHESYEEISYLVNLGVVKGYTEKGEMLYKPGKAVTRAQAAKMVVVASGSSPLAISVSSLNNVKAGREESGYIEKAISLGLFATVNGKFSPNEPLTREDMSYVLTKAI